MRHFTPREFQVLFSDIDTDADGVVAEADLVLWNAVVMAGLTEKTLAAAWNNLLTVVDGQLRGDSAPWEGADDDLFGEREREAMHIVQYGPLKPAWQLLWSCCEKKSAVRPPAHVPSIGQRLAEVAEVDGRQ